VDTVLILDAHTHLNPHPEASSFLLQPLHGGPRPLLHQPHHGLRTQDIGPELLLLQQLQGLQRRARVGQVPEIRRPRPVLQVVQVGDEARLLEVLLCGEVIEVGGRGERLHELETISRWGGGGDGVGDWAGTTSSSISKRVKPPYLGSSGIAGGAWLSAMAVS
jgi:hypothetical protein